MTRTQPVISATQLSYCDPEAGLAVSPLDNAQETRAVASRCPASAAWTHDTLVYLTLANSRGLAGSVAHVWKDGRETITEALVDVNGVGRITLSSDGAALMYSNADELVEIDLVARMSKAVGPGRTPRFNPARRDVYAVLNEALDIEIRSRSGTTLATFELPPDERASLPLEVDPVGLAWSPDGDALAISTPSCLTIWYVDSNESTCALEAASGQYFLPTVLWFR